MSVFKELRRMPRWEAAVLALSMAAMGGWWAGHSSASRPSGSIAVAAAPDDAIVLIDNVKVGDAAPVMIEKAPGAYTISITRNGYTRVDRDVDVRPGEVTTVKVKLEPSPDTGFELTSEPNGQPVWLDGQPVRVGLDPALTDFRAFRIAPGHHLIEIHGDRFKFWRQEVEVAAGEIRRVHAVLIPERGLP